MAEDGVSATPTVAAVLTRSSDVAPAVARLLARTADTPVPA